MNYFILGPGCMFGPFDAESTRRCLRGIGCVPTDDLLGEYIDCDKDKVTVYDVKDLDKVMARHQEKVQRQLAEIVEMEKQNESHRFVPLKPFT